MNKLLIAALLTLAGCHSDRPQPTPQPPRDNCAKTGDCTYDDGQPK